MTTRRLRKKSEKIIERLKVAKYHGRNAYEAIACYKLRDIGVDLTKEQDAKLQEASQDFWSAERKVYEIFAELIGKQIVREL